MSPHSSPRSSAGLSMENSLVIIPARHAARRFPGKMLAQLRSRSVIEYSWRAALAARGDADAVFVATDHDAIAAEVRGFGGQVVMTDPACRNGTERVAQALERLGLRPPLVFNLQGDAPLTPAWFLKALAERMARRGAAVATPVLKTTPEAYRAFLEDAARDKPGATTAVFDRQGRALYFSKRVLPYLPADYPSAPPVYHHVGLYAYTPEALDAYRRAELSTLEQLEGLEQLRFLNEGIAIECVEVEDRGFAFWEVNNPEDIARIKAGLARSGDPNGL